jgi:putative transposase
MMNIPPESLPQRQKLPHGAAPWVRGEIVYFVTVCCSPRGINQLCVGPVSTAIWESLEFRQQRRDRFVHLWLLMPDHLHALVSFSKAQNLTKTIANWKEITAKKAAIGWQRDFFDHRLRSAQELREKETYIRQNPVRKGVVERAEDWKFVWCPDGGPSGPALP